jgi:5'-nucleotidase / UDP-sugar diphosphatase
MKIKAKTMIAAVLLTVMSAGATFPHPAAGQPATAKKTLTIAFTHDLHDHYVPLLVKQDGTIVRMGGWARLAAAIAEERERDPHLLVVDAGDYSMGTMFQMLFAEESPGLRLLGQMGYDAVTLGNHEYDFLPEGLARHLQSASQSKDQLPAIVASNVVFPQGDMPADLVMLKKAFLDYPVLDYTVVEKGSLRIGLFGLMGQEADSNAPMAGVSFADQIETARQMVEILRTGEQVDLVICLSHSGTHPDPKRSEDAYLAEQVTGIDVIISGHSHTLLPEPLIVNDTVIVSAGQYGTNLGILKMQADDSGWQVGDYQLIGMDANKPKHAGIEATILSISNLLEERYLNPLGLGLDDVLAESPFSFTSFDQIGAEHREEPLGNLIADAYRYAVAQAEGDQYEEIAVAVVPSGIIRGSFVKGPISAYDAFVVSSLGTGPDGRSGFPLLSVYLNGKELKRVCEVDASVTPLMSSAQLYMSGITYTFNPSRLPLNKVTDAALVDRDGNRVEIVDEELYRVVVGLYSAQMLSVVGEKSFGLLPIEPKDQEGNPIEDYLAHIIYVQHDGNVMELKEWIALVEYLQSFTVQNGVPVVPAMYQTAVGRKNIVLDRSIAAVLSRPNDLAVKVYMLLAAIVLLLGSGLIIIALRRRRNRLEI